MFKIKEYEAILQSCLALVPDTLDKRQGSIIYDAIAPCCVELAQMYIALYGAVRNVFINTATGESLDLLTAQNGINRKPATNAIRRGLFNKEVDIDSRFSYLDTTYVVLSKVTETAEPFDYRLQCEQVGSIGNKYVGELTPITQINGLTKAILGDVLIVGDDMESDINLKERYKKELTSPSFGGNIAYYKEAVGALEGIGGVKVEPIWKGGGTVKIIVSGLDMNPVSQETIDYVQKTLDPTPKQTGLGLAPIGHDVTVEGVKQKSVAVAAVVTIGVGAEQGQIENDLLSALYAYFVELSNSWGDENNLIVRVARITNILLDVEGVVDITNVTINNQSSNLVLLPNESPNLTNWEPYFEEV